MRYHYKMTIAYDGGRYNGWQRQDNTPFTIQGQIERALSKILEYDISIIGSGRTDAGVHAYGQVANVHLPFSVECNRWITEGNQHLPEDIKILHVEEVDENFHSRYSATSKYYLYRISEVRPSVFERRYVYSIQRKLNHKKMKEAMAFLVGTHDFYGFSSLNDRKKNSVRTLYDIQLVEKERELQLLFHGDGFLYNMVRILTGTLIEIGLEERDMSCILQVIETKKRKYAGRTAPAQGLFLEQVMYSE